MNNHQYAPGRPGFGSRGEDGSAGLAGLSLYFTDYDTTTESALIQTAIINNVILCSSTLYDQAAAVLPGGRTYNSGDLFVDINGGVYEITDASTGSYTYKYASLNTAGYFTSAETQTDIHGFRRFFNNNLEPKYIIDNVYASEEANYYSVPSDIYTIESKNFARIEYSNINQGNYNPFTVYSAGDSDQNSIAIVRDVCSNTFRIGNLDSLGNLRNVKLIFDVSSLRVNKQDSGTHFTPNTVEGTVITNYEINANSLFNGNFDSSPDSFSAFAGHNYATISWDKSDFANDTDVIMDLHFYKDSSSSTTISVSNASDHISMIYPCGETENLTITGLTESTPYRYYMSLMKNGWVRNSDIKYFTTSALPYLYLIHSSAATYLWADSSGTWDGSTRSDSTHYKIDVSTNSITGWYIDGIFNPDDNPCPPYDTGVDWITCNPMEGSAGYSSFLVSVTRNTGSNRSAMFYVNSTATQKYMYVMQRGPGENIIIPPVDPEPGSEIPYISFTNDGSLDVTTLGNYSIDVSIYMYAMAALSNMGPGEPGGGYAIAQVNFTRENPFYSVLCNVEATWQDNGEIPQTAIIRRSLTDISLGTICTVTGYLDPYQNYPVEVWGEAYIKIVRAKYHGTNVDVSIINNKWNIYYDYNQGYAIDQRASYEAPTSNELQ